MKWKYQSRHPLDRVFRKLGTQYNTLETSSHDFGAMEDIDRIKIDAIASVTVREQKICSLGMLVLDPYICPQRTEISCNNIAVGHNSGGRGRDRKADPSCTDCKASQERASCLP